MKMYSAMLTVAVLAGTGTVQVEFGGKTFILNGGANRVCAAEQKSTPVMVQDFEKAEPQPRVWVVNIPNENASVQLSTDQPHDGKQCLKLHYHFLGTGNFQYLGIPNKVKIQAPVHKLHFWLKGDNSKCSYGVQVTDASGETHQYRSLSSGTGQGGIVDFTGWKEVVFDLDAPHETWGGDKNGKLDYPITGDHLHRRPADGKGRRQGETVARRGRPVLRFPQRRLREERRRDLGLPGCRGLAGLLLRRARRHARHPRGARLQERDREMLEARRRVSAPIPPSPRWPSMRKATARSSSRPMPTRTARSR